MFDALKLQPREVKNEVKRIKKLPKDEQEAQMNVLQSRIKEEMDIYYGRRSTMTKSGQNIEDIRLSKCMSVLRWKWEKPLRKYSYDKDKEWKNSVAFKENKSQNTSQYMVRKVNTAHFSGLPLPEQAEVYIWWKGEKLFFASAATEFSLPVERVLGMGKTYEKKGYGGSSYYLTIEYKKGDVIKSIVVRVNPGAGVNNIITQFDQIKGTREMNKQEL